MERKYELKEDSIEVGGRILYRIKALRDFDNVKKGDLGGYIEKEENLSHEGNCWIYDNACVYDIKKKVFIAYFRFENYICKIKLCSIYRVIFYFFDSLLSDNINSSTADIGIFHTLPILKALIFLLFSNLYALLRPINRILHMSSMVIKSVVSLYIVIVSFFGLILFTNMFKIIIKYNCNKIIKNAI